MYYNIICQTKYHIELEPVSNIEDCGEEFIDGYELNELGCSGYGLKRFFTSKMKKEINQLLSNIPEGKKSILIKDIELLEAIKDYKSSISKLVPNTRRVGDRLFKYIASEKVKTKVEYTDWKHLVGVVVTELNNSIYNIDMRIRNNTSNREGTILFIRKLFSWGEILELVENSRFSYDEEELKWMKMLYVNPKSLNKKDKD